jgi:hypothetical protein
MSRWKTGRPHADTIVYQKMVLAISHQSFLMRSGVLG